MESKKPKRKSYQKRVLEAVPREHDFLLAQLAREWDTIHRGAKREELIRRSRETAGVVAKALLVLLATGGVVVAAGVAPNVFAAYGRLTKRRGFFEQKRFRRAVTHLRHRGFVLGSRDRTRDEYTLKLTSKGLAHTLHHAYKNLAIPQPRRWDGIWRLVIFDIPDKHKAERETFRLKLRRLGFFPLQESVFVLPHPCREEIGALVSLLGIAPYVRFIETNSLSEDDDLRHYFELG